MKPSPALDQGNDPAAPSSQPPSAAKTGSDAGGADTKDSRPADNDPIVAAAPDAPAGTIDYQPAAGEADPEPGSPLVTTDYPPEREAGADVASVAAAGSTAPPLQVAGYEILGVLGRGGYGVVYKARQPGLKRIVALKMILAGKHSDEHGLARFRSEAEVVARLQHPNIVQVYEVGEDEGRPFFSLEFVDGTSLKEKIAGTPQPPREAARLARMVALAMDHAHQHGVIHRDLKPANVLMTQDGVPKVGDFGLARRLEEDSGETGTGAAVGTPSYMAPEQAEGRSREAGPLADVYSLGAVLYELLTGRAPFRGASILETLEQVRTREPVAPTLLQPGVPRDLETICLKCLHKEPARRYASAADLAEDLRRFLDGEPIVARPVAWPERTWRWYKRNPVLGRWIAAAVFLVVAWAVTASLMAWQLDVKNVEKENARAEAVQRKEEAERNEKKAEQNAQLADRNATVAKEMAGSILDKMRVMTAAAVGLYLQLQSKRLRQSPGYAQGGQRMFDEFQTQVSELVKEIDEKKISHFAAVRAYQVQGDLMKQTGRGKEALRLYRAGYDKAKALREANPDNDIARANMGVMRVAEGDAFVELDGDGRAALPCYREARELFQDVLDHPRGGQYKGKEWDLKKLVTFADCGLGKAYLAMGDPLSARRCLEECRAGRDAWTKADNRVWPRSYLAEAHLWLGTTAWHLGDKPGVVKHISAALGICQQLCRQLPNFLPLEKDVADVWAALGEAQLHVGKATDAEKSYRESLRIIESVVARAPDITSLPLLALTHERLGTLALLRGRRAEAEKHYQEALALRDELMQIEPNNLAWRAGHTVALARCGKHAEAARAAEDLRRRAPRNTETLLQVARCYAVCSSLDSPQKQSYREKALLTLRDATQNDYRDRTALETDPELKVLQQEPGFRQILTAVGGR